VGKCVVKSDLPGVHPGSLGTLFARL
jgi:hypothetical protein